MFGYQNRGVSNRWIGSSSISTIAKDLDKNFKPINILVFKNGDMYDHGMEVSVTRRQFPNWLTLLDYLTGKLHLVEGAVHAIYTIFGEEVRTFQELENGQWYVGAHGKFRPAPYGDRVPPQWKGTVVGGGFGEPKGISSKESLEMYLRSRGYKPILGDVWDDSQFDLMRSNGVFHSPLTRRREYSRALEQRRKSRAPSRARSADGIDYRHSHTRNSRRSKTEETIHRNGAKTTRHTTRSLPSARTRLPYMASYTTGKGRVINSQRHIGNASSLSHFQKNQNGRPGTATMSSQGGNRRSLASAATQRAMQWNARPVLHRQKSATSVSVAVPPPRQVSRSVEDAESSLYKPVDPRVAKAQEDRVYQFYERQKELELKRGILERAAKRPLGVTGPESIIRSDPTSSFAAHGNTAGRAAYDSYARRPRTPPQVRVHRQPLQAVSTTKPPPYRLPAPEHVDSTSLASNGRKPQVPPLKAPVAVVQRQTVHGMGTGIEKSPRWVEELTGAVERLAREVSTLSKKNQYKNESISYSKLYDSD